MVIDTLLKCPFCQSENIDIIDEATGFAECLSCASEFDLNNDD